MPRAYRIEFNGAIHHVFQRGNNREDIFKEDIDKGFFLKLVKSYCKNYNCSILAYAVMDNHYHIVLRNTDASLKTIMHNINNSYAKYYNRRNDRTGHVFEDRYKSKLVEDDSYLIWLLRYIHRNPVKAHLCDYVSNYKWSSDFFYRRNISSFVDINFILEIISENRILAHKTYLNLVEFPEKEGIEDYEYIKGTLLNKISSNKKTIPENSQIIPKIHMRESLNAILSNLNPSREDFQSILSGSRKRNLTNIKINFIKNALDNNYTLKEIGEFINLSESGICRILKRSLEKNKKSNS